MYRGVVQDLQNAVAEQHTRDPCVSKGVSGFLADDTTARVSEEILFEPINNKETELHKDREGGKADWSYLHVNQPTTHQSLEVQRLNSKEGGSAAR